MGKILLSLAVTAKISYMHTHPLQYLNIHSKTYSKQNRNVGILYHSG